MLDLKLQPALEAVYERILESATVTADAASRGPSEVSWVEKFHNLTALHLEPDLRAAMRATNVSGSVQVTTAFVHGNPFQIAHTAPLSKGVEAGDLLVVGERLADDGTLARREALLLQLKVGPPRWSAWSASTAQQALLYGAWPTVLWRAAALRTLPGPHPRTPSPAPCRAAQFGVIPTYTSSGYEAWPLTGPGKFGTPVPLATELAAVTRTALGADATPGPDDGWPRIVEDVLQRAMEMSYSRRTDRYQLAARLASEVQRGVPAGPRHVTDDQTEGGRFAVIVVRTGGVGQLD
jgi:hypothetical protein